MTFPRATVRLQLHRNFTFADAAATIGYYRSLGISHFYLSPIFAARAGSTHGYDVTDPTRINPELGGEAGFVQLVSQLRAAGMGAVIDIVPNHMGVAGGGNPYWEDVLARGAQSAYAHWFDIDWQHPDPRLAGKLLLPVLGEPYEAALESGVLATGFDAASGRCFLACYDSRLPLSAHSHDMLLRGEALLADTAHRFGSLPASSMAQVHAQLAALAATADGQAAMARAMARYAHGTAGAPQALHQLLQAQHYRLSWWRNAAEEINWRRFFEVSDLAGVCVEKPDVFEATHALVFDLYRRGLIDGVRIDHVDGLADPGGYCRRVRERLSSLQAGRPEGLREAPAWIVVEKILTPGETLRSDWGVDGTTGYDFMDQAGAVLHDPEGEAALRRRWARLTGDGARFDDHVLSAREQLLAENFIGELDALARLLQRHAAGIGLAGRDVAPPAIRRVLSALLASFRRYRCYGDDGEDHAVLRAAVEAARNRLHFHDHALLHEVGGWLSPPPAPDGRGMPEPAAVASPRSQAVTRFRQLTPPLAAKSVEDTVFYRHAPVLSRNDVGSYPEAVSGGVEAFHTASLRRAARFPHAMLATATHDHKRGEDSRARLAVLTEIEGDWSGLVESWRAAHQPLRATVPLPADGLLASPAAPDEAMLYQAILGAWPPGLQPDDAAGLAVFADRMAAWQEKALREAKLYSSWMLPHDSYEAACRAFLRGLLAGEIGRSFRSQMAGLVGRISAAAAANSLTQALLRLASPGIPDLYQGAELADFSLVDPDNRSPVDMALRLRSLSGTASPAPALAEKQALIRHALALRRQHPGLFDGGQYLPLDADGPLARHVIAFERRDGDTRVLAVGLRLPAAFMARAGSAPWTAAWGKTTIAAPLPGDGRWIDTLGGAEARPVGGRLWLRDILGRTTAALLTFQDT